MRKKNGGGDKMSFDYQATAEGDFLLEIRDWKTGMLLGEVCLQGLNPFQKLSREVLIGD